MSLTITAPEGAITHSVLLPASKSISNRALVACALASGTFNIKNLSQADDTRTLLNLLKQSGNEFYCGEGGTTLRFLMAYLGVKGGKFRITAAPSLMQRPLSPLIGALELLGCTFDFESEKNKLPFTISSSGLRSKGELSLPGDVSSQFISALMLAGPYIEGGIIIRIVGEIMSLPYIRMTAAVMRSFGVVAEISDDVICIQPGRYTMSEYSVEPDWSAASYWFEIAALRAGSRIFMPGLSLNSIQGDSSIVSVMSKLGVETSEADGGIYITGSGKVQQTETLIADLSGAPDTAPALIAACAGLKVTADFPGLKNFRLKETDRAAAFQREIYNFGVNTDFCGGSKFKVYGDRSITSNTRIVKTYRDHRVAMALAPLSLVAGPVSLDDPSVVTKSYPSYFDDLKSAGFVLDLHD
jgi:3-phosphoshikimate 1-carboxyvinyltransferase